MRSTTNQDAHDDPYILKSPAKEAEFSKDIIAGLRLLHIKAHKMSDRYNRGTPDIYVPGGNWIESKRLVYTTGHYGATVLSAVKPAQQKVCTELSENGDRVIIAIMWIDRQSANRIGTLFVPWELVKLWGQLPKKFILKHSIPWSKRALGIPMDHVFDPVKPRLIADRWAEMEEYVKSAKKDAESAKKAFD